ncbi:hypothetical protein BKA66DRAFT_571072 [Pyrenochaeta sp. MPI-SDFR-AT-0127]|nr:hypothetical protein BKA66DRAFT_571072 [Pyrenochaeta sp. MPI-SDFR-AT-0127]
MTAFPVDIWLLIFDIIDDLDTLWSIVRNVAHFFRDCVDEYFRHGIIQNTFLHLYYSTINRSRGPIFEYVRLPMRFACFSDCGTRAIFHQVDFIKQVSGTAYGSVRGWVPFIERYCEDTLQRTPKVLNMDKSAKDSPLWEKEHASLRNTLTEADKRIYIMRLRDHTSIGRGDRPPYYLKMRDYVHDTKLVDLVIDCSKREVSFDWRCTFAALFVEQHFLDLADRNTTCRKLSHDENLASLTLRLRDQGYMRENVSDERRVRRKRLWSWVGRNKHRMTTEHRLLTEDRIEIEKGNVRLYLHKDNMRDFRDEALDGQEYVPEKCAEDHMDLLLWPWGGDDSFFIPKRRLDRLPKRCIVL